MYYYYYYVLLYYVLCTLYYVKLYLCNIYDYNLQRLGAIILKV